jgi:hypothetical protein
MAAASSSSGVGAGPNRPDAQMFFVSPQNSDILDLFEWEYLSEVRLGRHWVVGIYRIWSNADDFGFWLNQPDGLVSGI